MSPIFGDHMVLQRGKKNSIWGWTTPGASVTLTIGGHKATAIAESSGRWEVKLDPPHVGGPYSMSIEGPQKVKFDDILVGDVWLCSGQSNMEMGIGMVTDSQAEIASADHPYIRLLMVQRTPALKPLLATAGTWKVCSPKSITDGGWNGFSAVAYFFGREIQNRTGIPVGLVESNWGGTPAEAWTAPRGLARVGDFDETLKLIEVENRPETASYCDRLASWLSKVDPGSYRDWSNPNLEDTQWQTTKVPIRYEDLGLRGFHGVVWFRRTFTLPDQYTAGDSLLTVGTVDSTDTTWVNGSPVGETYSIGIYRQYRLNSSILKPGKNSIVIRVISGTNGGGFTLPPEHLNLRLADNSVIPLGGDWKYSVGADISRAASPMPVALRDNPYTPTSLFNGMIAPLAPLAIKGAIWYQGESNVGRGAQYAKLLPSMVDDWRHIFGQDFPFYIVQLANFGDRHPNPVEDAWSELREAQAKSADLIKSSGLAVAIDIGDAKDIHPQNKQEVGRRLALIALKKDYGKKIEYSGPKLASARAEGRALRLTFTHAEGLNTKARPIKGFQIAGADHKFFWAQAQIEGKSIVLSAPEVTSPRAARYAWDSDPEASIYNSAGLPASPFQISTK